MGGDKLVFFSKKYCALRAHLSTFYPDFTKVSLGNHPDLMLNLHNAGKITRSLLDNKGNNFLRRKVKGNIIYMQCNVPSCSAKAQALCEDPSNMELTPTIIRLDQVHMLSNGSAF